MTEFDQWATSVTRIVTLLKKRFPNMTAEEALTLATQCVKAVLTVPQAEHER